MITKQNDAANERWRQHSDDEADARAAQQAAAGPDHQPVQGPPPYGNAHVNLIAAEIVQRERERCARLVETWPAQPGSDVVEVLRGVAEAIRRQP